MPAIGGRSVELSESGLATVAWVDYQSEGADLDWHILARRFALPCLDDGASLCLGGRFRVTAQWRTADGGLGIGRPRPLGEDSGAFWFFGEPNLELIVKVLDGCAINQKHWVYVAGLTDVAVQLAVLDTWTGEVWSTTTDLLERFPATQDVEALGGCQATAPNAGTLPPAAKVGSHGGLEASWAETTACVPDEGHLCLQGGRFRVGATYATDIGLAGEAHAVPLEPDSGGFWFFGPDNLELLVKVLDACVPFERFWVYAAGLTNVGVTLVVEDMATGAVREYRNPLGTPFAPSTTPARSPPARHRRPSLDAAFLELLLELPQPRGQVDAWEPRTSRCRGASRHIPPSFEPGESSWPREERPNRYNVLDSSRRPAHDAPQEHRQGRDAPAAPGAAR